MRRRLTVFGIALAALVGGPALLASPARPKADDVGALLGRLQAAVQAGDEGRFAALLAPEANVQSATAVARSLFANPPATRVTLRERDRVPLRDTPADRGLRIAVDAFIETGSQARIHSWQVDVTRPDPASRPNAPWSIAQVAPVSFIDGLERLSVDATTQYRARNLTVQLEDAEVRVADAAVFVVRSADGLTGAVVIGNGEFAFHPTPAVERGQVKLFAGTEALVAKFDAVYLRFNPADAEHLVAESALVPETVDPRLAGRAAAIFRDEGPRSFVVDLGDLGAGTWWVRPLAGDVVAEVRTRKYGSLTYSHAWQDHENVALFDRQRKRHISVYASAAKLAARGPFYDDADGRDYTVLHYDIDAVLAPEAHWITAWTRLRVRIVQDGVSRITLKLADGLKVTSIASSEYGRLLGLRARGHSGIVVSFPKALPAGTDLDLSVSYEGALTPEIPGQETLTVPQDQVRDEVDFEPMPLEPAYIYSGRSYWYAQATEPGFATASIRLQVPADFACVGSGELTTAEPLTMGVVSSKNPGDARHVYTFAADRPVRYLAFVVSRFTRISPVRLPMAAGAAPSGGNDAGTLSLAAEVTNRFKGQGQKLIAQAAAIAGVYGQLAGGTPYPSLTLALIERDLPGGHSPAYFSVVNQVMPSMGRARKSWAGDPATFPDFPEYFLAHEVAHQWWGQAVGTKNYHEQWISEGFAQYFAALYAERAYGPIAYRTIVRQFRRWTLDTSDQGPVYLGARLGHIQGDSRIFRALVYNKGALVLHMLRQMLGDEVFFRGLRQFYTEYRYAEAGTSDVQRVFETVAGRSLAQFFDGWIYGQDLPHLTVSVSVGGGSQAGPAVRITQGGQAFDVPVPILVEFEDGTSRIEVIPVTGPVTERVIAVDRPVRRIGVSLADLAAVVRTG